MNLDLHIQMFPSDFDGTSIASKLKADNVSISTYEEIKNTLWKNYKSVIEENMDLKLTLQNIKCEIDEHIF